MKLELNCNHFPKDDCCKGCHDDKEEPLVKTLTVEHIEFTASVCPCHAGDFANPEYWVSAVEKYNSLADVC